MRNNIIAPLTKLLFCDYLFTEENVQNSKYRSLIEEAEACPAGIAAYQEIFQPFAHGSFRLEPEPSLLRESAQEAIFWAEVCGVRTYAVREALALKRDVKLTVRTSMRNCLPSDQIPVRNGQFLKQGFLRRCEQEWMAFVFQILGTVSRRSRADIELDAALQSLRIWMRDLLRQSLWSPYLLLTKRRVTDARKFKPLHQLILRGVVPVGFDRETNLLVL